MNDRANHLRELFDAGAYEFLADLVFYAEQDSDCRETCALIGVQLEADGTLRGVIKRSGIWDRMARKLRAEAPPKSGPWWKILAFADGEKVGDDVQTFFRG
jgi:hypothetical protein